MYLKIGGTGIVVEWKQISKRNSANRFSPVYQKHLLLSEIRKR